MTDAGIGQRLAFLLLAAFTVTQGLAVAAHRHLFADGGYYFVDVIGRRDVVRFIATRLHMHLLAEGAMVLAARQGGWSFAGLSLLFGVGLVLAPLALWALALAELRDEDERRNWLAALLVLTVLCGFYSISEGHWAAALFVWMAAALARPAPLGAVRTAALPVAMYLALRTYESYALFGPLLSLLAVPHLRRALGEARARTGAALAALALLAVIALGLAQSTIAVAEVLAPRDPRNRTGAIMGLLALPETPAAWIMLALVIAPWPRGGRSARLRVALALLATTAAFATPALLSIGTQSRLRSLTLWLPLAIALQRAGLPAALSTALPRRAAAVVSAASAWRLSRRALLGLAVFALGWNAAATLHWTRFAAALRRDLAASGSLVLALPPERRAPFYSDWCAWTLESTSVALQLVAPGAPPVPPPGRPLSRPLPHAVAPEATLRLPLPY